MRNTSIQTAPPDIESPPVSVPAGTPENSPAIYRWVWAPPLVQSSPEGASDYYQGYSFEENELEPQQPDRKE